MAGPIGTNPPAMSSRPIRSRRSRPQAPNSIACSWRAGQAVVDSDVLLDRFAIPRPFHAAIRAAWEAEPPALNIGRFDLGYDGRTPPKLFEFKLRHADRPAGGGGGAMDVEGGGLPHAGQCNGLHEALVAKWADISPYLPPVVHIAHVEDDAGEDSVTAAYLRDTARAGGVETVPLLIDAIGWDHDRRCFVDADDRRIAACWKLYPWEWLAQEAFAPMLLDSLSQAYCGWSRSGR